MNPLEKHSSYIRTKHKDAKVFENHPCHVCIDYCQMSTHVPGLGSYFRCLQSTKDTNRDVLRIFLVENRQKYFILLAYWENQ